MRKAKICEHCKGEAQWIFSGLCKECLKLAAIHYKNEVSRWEARASEKKTPEVKKSFWQRLFGN